jgi:hypothetical protein
MCMQERPGVYCVASIAVDEASEAFLESECHSRKASTSRGTHGPRVHARSHICLAHRRLCYSNPNTVSLDDRHPFLRSYYLAPHHVAQHAAPVRPEPAELAQGHPLDTVRLAIADSPPDMPPAACALAAAEIRHRGRGHQQGRCACPSLTSL